MDHCYSKRLYLIKVAFSIQVRVRGLGLGLGLGTVWLGLGVALYRKRDFYFSGNSKRAIESSLFRVYCSTVLPSCE